MTFIHRFILVGTVVAALDFTSVAAPGAPSSGAPPATASTAPSASASTTAAPSPSPPPVQAQSASPQKKVASPQPQSHPDASPFEIPQLPEPANGFGTMLENACDALKGVDSTKLKAKVASEQQAATTASELAPICTSIEQGTLKDADLAQLRKWEKSGTLPDVLTFLTRPSGATEGAVSGAPSLAGFESNLINGLADFIVTRAKEEAILYLQDEIQTKYCKGDAATLLPNTCATLKDLDSGLSISAIGTALNAAARRDLVQLPDGALKIASEKDTANFYVYEPLRLLYAVVLEVRNGRIPQEVVRSIHALPLRECESAAAPRSDADMRCRWVFSAFRLSSALLYAAQASSIDQVAKSLPKHQIRVTGALIEAESLYDGPFADAIARAKNEGNGAPGVEPPLALSIDQLNALNRVLGTVAETLVEWKQRQTALTGVPDSKSTATDRRRVLGLAVFDTLVRTSRLVKELTPVLTSDPTTRTQIDRITTLSRDSAVIGADAVNEDYGALLTDAGTLVNDLGSPNGDDELSKVLAVARKFVPIVTEIASAKSSADVSAALEAAAAPASSYRAKYQRSEVSINALVGAFAGGESPSDPINSAALGSTTRSGVIAGFAPVGVEGTVPLCSHLYGGLMLSVIDLGAITTARFKSEISDKPNVSSPSDVTFAQVFSPGAYLLFGIGKSPITIGGGASFAPSLRTLETTNAGNVTSEKVSAIRYGGFLAVDVTFLPL